MQDAKEWLEDEQKDYSIGLALLAKYSKNRILIQNLAHKARLGKVIYELKKICSRKNITVNTNSNIPILIDTIPLHVDAIKTLIKSKPIIKCSELPDHLQVLWRENTEKYKLARALHEKCKLLEDAKKRAPVLEELENIRKTIFSNWEYLDLYIEEQKKGPKTEEKGPKIDNNGINAARTFLSKGLACLKNLHGTARAKKIDAMQKRVNELQDAEAPITAEYKNSLEKTGIKFNG
jgi:hypothetical protein